jgi:acylphosphatase
VKEAMKRKSIVVKGQVQGVFFRAFTQKEARRLGLTGHVSNKADGSVYIEAQGKDVVVEAFTQWCKFGSPLATVQEINDVDIDCLDEEDFMILK